MAHWIADAEGIRDVGVMKVALVALLCPDIHRKVLHESKEFLSEYRLCKVRIILQYMDTRLDNLPIIMPELDIVADVYNMVKESEQIYDILLSSTTTNTVGANMLKKYRNKDVVEILKLIGDVSDDVEYSMTDYSVVECNVMDFSIDENDFIDEDTY
jgi:hypothetical protein